MQRRSTTTILAVGAVVAGLAIAGPASAATLKGTVVNRNAKARSFTIASKDGSLKAIHARRSPRPGSVVRLKARKLRNGTYAAKRVRTAGRRSRARMRGTVTYVNRQARAFTVSAAGASILVRSAALRGARTAADQLPAVGDMVTADVTLGGSAPEARDVQDEGQDTDGIELEGVVQAIDEQARTLSISADDEDESGASLTVQVPDTIDLTAFTVGESVSLNVLAQPDGTYVLTGSSSDEGAEGADDSSEEQGDELEDDAEDGQGDSGSDSQGSGGDSHSGSGDGSGSQDD